MRSLINTGFQNLKNNRVEFKNIRKDVLLKQAYIDKNEFFTV